MHEQDDGQDWPQHRMMVTERLSDISDELLKLRSSVHELRNEIQGRLGLIELSLERQNTSLEKHNSAVISRIASVNEEVEKFKAKATVWGAAGGLIVAAAIDLVVSAFRK